MSLSGFIPASVSVNAAFALVRRSHSSRAAARGFSGFGSALIFMPLASSIAAPRLVAPLLLVIDFVSAAPLLPNAWKQADRKATAVMICGALIGVPVGTYFLSRLEPVTTRWIISGFVFALLLLLLSGWRYRGRDYPALAAGIGGLAGFCSGLAQTGGPPIVGYWLGRPIESATARGQYPAVFWSLGFLFSRQLFPDGTCHRRCHRALAADRSGLCRRRVARRHAVWPRERKAVPLDLLRADRARGHHRIAGTGWHIALSRYGDSVRSQ